MRQRHLYLPAGTKLLTMRRLHDRARVPRAFGLRIALRLILRRLFVNLDYRRSWFLRFKERLRQLETHSGSFDTSLFCPLPIQAPEVFFRR